jgi:cellulose biosynthesis protein BcsQ
VPVSESSADIALAAPEPIPPLILAVASGKGGVGKTMLAVACAYELSLGGATLVIDLDFFNRGLSGLLRGRRDVGLIARPRFLDPLDAPPAAPWEVVEVEHQLYHIAYPDLVPDELVRLENRSAEDLSFELHHFIQRAVELCGARTVVLDCHGGPDHTSFAAALLADHTLLVSEPDRITLHGTLNFLRQLRRGADPARTDVRLVFNKIVPAFRTAFLRRFYDQSLRESFGGTDLLALFPLELPLTKAFEDTPLISRVYPYSFLARKMRVLLLDLIGNRAKDYLAPSALTLPRQVRQYRRRTLGRIPWFLNHEIILQIIAFVALVCALAVVFLARFPEPTKLAFFRAAILAELSRHPEIALNENDETYKLIKDPSKLNKRSLSAFDIRTFTYGGDDGKLHRALQTDGRSLFVSEAADSQDWTVANFGGEDEGYIRIADALSYFREHFADLPPPRGFEEEWQADVKTLRAAGVPNLKLGRILVVVVRDVGGYVAATLVIWLGVTLYIDWNRRLNILFVRMLHSSYALAVTVISVWIALWTLPLGFFASNESIRPKVGELSAQLLFALAMILGYFCAVAQQLYLCQRLYREGRCDLLHCGRNLRGGLPFLARQPLCHPSFMQELCLRFVFILALLSIAIFLFRLLTFRGLLL